MGSLIRRESALEGAKPVVIVRTSTGALGCAVDELLGRQEIVIKSLGALKPYERSVFGGATIDPEGRIVLVLDPARLTSGGEQAGAPLETLNETAAGTDTDTPLKNRCPSRPSSKRFS